jgi:hypothetical protein
MKIPQGHTGLRTRQGATARDRIKSVCKRRSARGWSIEPEEKGDLGAPSEERIVASPWG